MLHINLIEKDYRIMKKASSNPTASLIIRQVSLNDITVDHRQRQFSRPKMLDLAASIQSVGLRHPITVLEKGEDGKHEIAAGHHRFEALKYLGLTKTQAVIVARSAAQKEQIEIQENLVRHNLTVLERSEHHLKLKLHYEATFNTEEENGLYQRNNFVMPATYSARAAKLGDVSARSVQQELKIAAMPEQVKDLIRKTWIADRKVDLMNLSNRPLEDQQVIAQAITAGCKTFKEACQTLGESTSTTGSRGLTNRQAQHLKNVFNLISKLELKTLLESEECHKVIEQAGEKRRDLSATLVGILEQLHPEHSVRIMLNKRENVSK